MRCAWVPLLMCAAHEEDATTRELATQLGLRGNRIGKEVALGVLEEALSKRRRG